MPKYIVVSDHPYYPCAEYTDSLPEANKIVDEARKDLASVEGKYDCVITIATIVTQITLKSDY